MLLDVLEEHPNTGVEASPPPPSTVATSPITITSAAFSIGRESSAINGASAAPRHQRAIALYDCDAENPDELTFKRSEVIVVVKDVEVNWWVGHKLSSIPPLPY